MTTHEILIAAAAAKPVIALLSAEQKNCALRKMAEFLVKDCDAICLANSEDVKASADSMSSVMVDRLTLTPERVRAMADSVLQVAELPDPVGNVLEKTERPNGLVISKISVPFGVLAMIYESRPNVTSDAAALAFKSGNVCVLRGGKEAIRSNIAIVAALRKGLEEAGVLPDAVLLLTDTSRESARELMTASGYVDLLIPRGGRNLIKSCVENATVPCIETGTGICHIYVDRAADFDKALNIIDNAKTSRPSVCNAAECCLVDEAIADAFLPQLARRLRDDRIRAGKTPVELRLDERALAIISGTPASSDDFDTEFLDYIMAVKIVGGVDEAVEHIRMHSTGHSDAIVTEDSENAAKFISFVDSAAVYVNASTRFTDGGEFGFGCEIGISTQKMHARGPMGLKEITSYKYVIEGNGQIR